MEELNYDGNWTEDFEHENGNYVNQCKICTNKFIGHKRRVVCKNCAGADVIIMGSGGVGKGVSLAELKASGADLFLHQDKEPPPLSEIIERNRGITITQSHLDPQFVKKLAYENKRDKKSF